MSRNVLYKRAVDDMLDLHSKKKKKELKKNQRKSDGLKFYKQNIVKFVACEGFVCRQTYYFPLDDDSKGLLAVEL